MIQRKLDQGRAGFERPGQGDNRVSCHVCIQQASDSRGDFIARWLNADPAPPAEQRDAGRFIHQTGGIGFQRAAIQINPLCLLAHGPFQPTGKGGRPRFIRAIEQEEADGPIGCVQSAGNLVRIGLHGAGADLACWASRATI